VPRLGLGLVGQGGFAVAIALSFVMSSPDRAGVVLTAVLGGLVLSDLWSHRAVRRVLADAGELHTVSVAEADEAEEEERAAVVAAIHHAPPDGADDDTLAAEGHRAVGGTAEPEDAGASEAGAMSAHESSLDALEAVVEGESGSGEDAESSGDEAGEGESGSSEGAEGSGDEARDAAPDDPEVVGEGAGEVAAAPDDEAEGTSEESSDAAGADARQAEEAPS
jgi:hypothetical protein